MNDIELKVTRYNVAALIGWAGITLGLIGAVMHYFSPSYVGFLFLVVELIGGAIIVTFAGPLRRVSVHRVPASRR